MPFFNASPFFEETLTTLLTQTYSAIEWIFVDDHSTDNSVQILTEQFSDLLSDGYARLITNPNKGAGSARNVGLDHARGDYILWLDADDRFAPNLVEVAVNAALCNKADLVFFDYTDLGNSVEPIHRFPENTNLAYGSQFFHFTMTNPANWTKLYRREFILQHGLRFQNLTSCNDIGFSWSALGLAKKIVYVDQVLVEYRRHATGNISSKRSERSQNIFSAYDFIKDNLLLKQESKELIEKLDADITAPLIYELDNIKSPEKRFHFLQAYRNKLPDSLYRKYSKTCTKVSVIVPVFNAQSYLRECLESLCSQTLTECEILVINDGSTDDSLTILHEFEKLDSRIRLWNQSNHGLSYTRNRALREANGEIVVFVDSDDYLDTSALEQLYKRTIADDLDMLTYGGWNFDSSGLKNNVYWDWDVYVPKELSDLSVFSGDTLKSISHSLPVTACLTSYRRRFVEKQKLNFAEGMVYEDNLFFTQAILQCQRYGILKKYLYFRRLHAASITNNPEKHFEDYLRMSCILCDWVKAQAFPKILEENFTNKYLEQCCYRFTCLSLNVQEKYVDTFFTNLTKYRRRYRTPWLRWKERFGFGRLKTPEVQCYYLFKHRIYNRHR